MPTCRYVHLVPPSHPVVAAARMAKRRHHAVGTVVIVLSLLIPLPLLAGSEAARGMQENRTLISVNAQDGTSRQPRRSLQAACGGWGKGAFSCEKKPPSPHIPSLKETWLALLSLGVGRGKVLRRHGPGIHAHRSVAVETVSSEKHLWSNNREYWGPAASRAGRSSPPDSRSRTWELTTLALTTMPSWRNRLRISWSLGRSLDRAQKRLQRRHLTSPSQCNLRCRRQ